MSHWSVDNKGTKVVASIESRTFASNIVPVCVNMTTLRSQTVALNGFKIEIRVFQVTLRCFRVLGSNKNG